MKEDVFCFNVERERYIVKSIWGVIRNQFINGIAVDTGNQLHLNYFIQRMPIYCTVGAKGR